MSEPIKHNEDETSFSLTRRNRRGTLNSVGAQVSPLTWQEKAYERLLVLYGASKILSSIEGVEATFHEILTLCGTTFPVATAVLIEKRGPKITKVIWHAQNAGERIPEALIIARQSFSYLTGVKFPPFSGFPSDLLKSDRNLGRESSLGSEATSHGNYITLPLIIEQLPAFGLVQIEGSSDLDEKDLEFVAAMANLVAVAVDRHYRNQEARAVARLEVQANSVKLTDSEAHVFDLESEKEMRERFVSLLTHDLRTPLSAIGISSEMIQRRPENTESVRKLASRIYMNVARADQMISNLLDANRIRSGERLPLSLEFCDMADLLRKTLAELNEVHGERFVLEGIDHAEGYWDKRALRRVIENLCNNAVKYGNAEAAITITIRQGNGNTYVAIQNWGDVIPAEDQLSLFQQFRRSAAAHSGKKKGWGIGLTLVRGVAEAHGGTIELVSTKESGTVFTLIIPTDSRPFMDA
ncbi:MAG: sensor histidine kinase [Bdellovibrionota bacterium]